MIIEKPKSCQWRKKMQWYEFSEAFSSLQRTLISVAGEDKRTTVAADVKMMKLLYFVVAIRETQLDNYSR